MPRDYQHQGDAFTRRVRSGRGPRTLLVLRNGSTGRVYARRLGVSECFTLSVRAVLEAMRAGPEAADTLERGGARLYWQPVERLAVLLLHGEQLPAGTPEGGQLVGFLFAQRGKARRDGTRGRVVLLECVHCGHAVRTLYVSTLGPDGRRAEGGVWGCVRCLGLTYPSRQEHRTASGDGRLIHLGEPERWQTVRTGRAVARAVQRFRRRWAFLG